MDAKHLHGSLDNGCFYLSSMELPFLVGTILLEKPDQSVQYFYDQFGFNLAQLAFSLSSSLMLALMGSCVLLWTWTSGASAIKFYLVGPNCQLVALLFHMFS